MRTSQNIDQYSWQTVPECHRSMICFGLGPLCYARHVQCMDTFCGAMSLRGAGTVHLLLHFPRQRQCDCSTISHLPLQHIHRHVWLTQHVVFERRKAQQNFKRQRAHRQLRLASERTEAQSIHIPDFEALIGPQYICILTEYRLSCVTKSSRPVHRSRLN